MRIVPHTLQGKFLLGLVIIMLIMGGSFTLMLRSHMQELFLSEAREKANIMTAHTEAIQSYVRTILRPSVSRSFSKDTFIIEAMSASFITRKILSSLNFDDKEFSYRRVAKNARNPEYEVTPDESIFFTSLAFDPALKRAERQEQRNGKLFLVTARPIYFTADCLRCHGNPKDAPEILLERYGDTSGFYRKQGELAGLDILTVPIENEKGAVGKSVTRFALWFGMGILILIIVVQVFFQRLVIHNLRRVGAILQKNLLSESENDSQFFTPLQNEEEIEGMIHAIETLAGHLNNVRSSLKDYTKNLEGMVNERTADLENVLAARNADVNIFIQLLTFLNTFQNKKELLRSAIELAAQHFNVMGIAYLCGLSGSDMVFWPSSPSAAIAKKIKHSLISHVMNGDAACYTNIWYIPVGATGDARGLLALYWCGWDIKPGEHSPINSQIDLALAFGKQLGIALDNVDALDALLRQNTLLDSIVEGVADPLILLDHRGIPLLANSSARDLADRLLFAKTKEKVHPLKAQSATGKEQIFCLLELLDLPLPYESLEQCYSQDLMLASGYTFVVTLRSLRTGNEQNTRYVVHLRETTEEKRLMLHMRQKEKLAAVGQLTAGLVHEINNPLGIIRCYAELLGEAKLEEQSKKDIEIILRHVDRAQTVLSELLGFARHCPSAPAMHKIHDLLLSLLELFKPQAKAANINVLLEADDDTLLIFVDASILEQVILNLLLNALHATAQKHPNQGGLICIRTGTTANNKEIYISIVDNGVGIAEHEHHKVFDPFFSTKKPGTGTGLGLTLAFNMIRDMGGTLELQPPSKNEPGSIFTIFIPTTESK